MKATNKTFWGRNHELHVLNNLYSKNGSALTVLYGRRRVGKSYLVQNFAKDKIYLEFDGLEDQSTESQINHFKSRLYKQTGDELLPDVTWASWDRAFDYLTKFSNQSKKPVVILFDEFQWMSCNQSKLTSLIKSYWDIEWKRSKKVFLILCGSISSFMVSKVIHSKALYGRIDLEMNLPPLLISEITPFFSKYTSEADILRYHLIFGGVPRYLELISPDRSFAQNINDLFFSATSPLHLEYQKIFYSQFKEPRVYEKIVSFLSEGAATYSNIINALKLSDSGGSKSYLNNLMLAGFISYSENPIMSQREKKYYISDEFLRFYFKFIKPQQQKIQRENQVNYFQSHVEPKWSPWLGLSFENFCRKNAFLIAQLFKFEGELIHAGPLFDRSDKGFQVDLLFNRGNRLTLCEIKYRKEKIDHSIIPEVVAKVELLRKKIKSPCTIDLALIAPSGMTTSLKNKKFFQYSLTLSDLFKN